MDNPLKPLFGLLICYFVITPLFSADYYWVGNRGNWSDLSHWATTSGGITKHTSLPTRNDNVFIDNNSFAPSTREEIVLDLNDVYCNNFSATRGAFLNIIGIDKRINIYGNCDIQRQSGVGAFDGSLVFRSNNPASKSINFTDYHVRNVIFDDPNGIWSLNGSILVDNLLAIRDGHVTFENDLNIQPSFIEFAANTSGSATLKCDIAMLRSGLLNPSVTVPVIFMDLTNFDFQTPSEFSEAGFSIIVTNSRVEIITADKTTHINKLNFFGADDPLGFNYVELDVRGEGVFSIGNSLIIPNAYINGFVNFEFLTLQANRTYYWESGKDYRLENLTAIGNCMGTIRLFGSIGGIAANFQRFGSGVVNGLFLLIRDINASNRVFEAFNSRDLGNTDGWIINGEAQDFLGEDIMLCQGDTATIRPFPFSQNYTVLWSDGTTIDSFNAFEPGKIWLDVDIGSGCIISDTVIISSVAALDLGRDTSLCDKDSIVLDATIANGTYEWQDGSTTPTYNVGKNGTYNVTTAVGSCVQSDSIVVDYFQPNIELGNDNSFCFGDTITLRAPDGNISYVEWQDGSNLASYEVTASGVYSLTAYNETCSSTESIDLTFSEIPAIDLGEDIEICEGDSVLLDATYNGGTYVWQDGNSDAIYYAKESGNYTVNVAINGCATKDSIRVVLLDSPSVELGADFLLCDGDTLSLNAQIMNASSVEWSDGSTEMYTDITKAGRYFITGYNGICRAIDSIDINIAPRPSINLGEDRLLCQGDSTLLEINLPNATYLWSDGDRVGQRILKESGIYWAEVQVGSCSSRDTIELFYLDRASISLGPDTTLCTGSELAFDFTSMNLGYQWYDGSQLPTRVINTPGVYWLEVGASICTFRDSIIIDFVEKPIVDLGKDTTSCADDLLFQYNPLMDESILWSNGSTNNEIMVFESGNIIINVDRKGCMDSDTILVTFLQPTSFSLGEDVTICKGESFRLSPSISGDEYMWQDGSTETYIDVTDAGIYNLDMKVNGCTTSDEIEVGTQECLLYSSYIPTAFSPNQDGSNDTFAPQFASELIISGYQMTIFDRWGSLIFHSEDLSYSWDGSYNGNLLSMGSYVYVIEVDYIDYKGPGTRLEKGTIDIMR